MRIYSFVNNRWDHYANNVPCKKYIIRNFKSTNGVLIRSSCATPSVLLPTPREHTPVTLESTGRIRKLRPREMKRFAQSHTARWCWGWHTRPGITASWQRAWSWSLPCIANYLRGIPTLATPCSSLFQMHRELFFLSFFFLLKALFKKFLISVRTDLREWV